MDLRSNWTSVHVPFARKGIALCRRNHATVKSGLVRAAASPAVSEQDRRVLRRLVEREFGTDKRFPMWVTIWRDEWDVVSRALRGGEGMPATPVYSLLVVCIRRGGKFRE